MKVYKKYIKLIINDKNNPKFNKIVALFRIFYNKYLVIYDAVIFKVYHTLHMN